MAERSLVMTSQAAGLGDVILASPFLKALRERHPGGHLALFTSRAGAEAARAYHAWWDSLYVDEPANRRKLLAGMKSERFDAAWCLSEAFSSIVLALRSGARAVHGFNWNGRGLFLDTAVRYRKPERMHVLDYYGMLAGRSGIVGYAPATWFPVPEEARETARDRLRERAGAVPSPYVAIHPGAGDPARRWPAERYFEIVRRLAGERTVRVVVVGGPAERPLAASVPAAANVHNAIDRFALVETAALIEGARLFVGNDGGLLQLAAALGKPMVALYRAADLKTVPRHPGARIVRARRGERLSNDIGDIPLATVWEEVCAALQAS